ncbi:MAG: hypothetical protein KatS3mg008_1914 [Acidimicrobiales bacterium]|nr:MAG: hypothetical protein KatS3mg008_1914 [Acidimicrobiales bacterium]
MEELNPVQRRILEVLGAKKDERPEFDEALADRIQSHMEESLRDVAEALGERGKIYVSKRDLAGVLACEAQWLDDAERDFEWNAAVAKGTVVHKALELAVFGDDSLEHTDLVDKALERVAASDQGLALWLDQIDPAELGELKSAAVSLLSQAEEILPPLRKEWRPVLESRVKAELNGGRIALVGRVDLTLGRVEGRRAGKVVVDLKTGSEAEDHLHHLRFYALLELLRMRVPPRMVATIYLESASVRHEEVTEHTLQAAAERVIRGVRRIFELKNDTDADPVKRPGPSCGWCRLLGQCEEGTSYLAEARERQGW